MDDIIFQHAGLTCLIKSCLTMHLCGYVGIPQSHPLYGIKYNKKHPVLITPMNQRLREPMPKNPGLGIMIPVLFGGELKPTPEQSLKVHGQITFADHWEGYPDLWFFGFDLGHAGDEGLAWNEDYVRKQCELLADQLSVIKGGEEGDDQARTHQAEGHFPDAINPPRSKRLRSRAWEFVEAARDVVNAGRHDIGDAIHELAGLLPSLEPKD